MELEVVVSKGRGLLAMDTSMFSKSSSDPYVVVVVEGKEIGRTEVVSKSLNPCWSERTSFRAFVAGTGPVSVELRLFDKDKLSRDARARVRRFVVETRTGPGAARANPPRASDHAAARRTPRETPPREPAPRVAKRARSTNPPPCET